VVQIPLGLADGKPIVYRCIAPKDNWREFWTKKSVDLAGVLVFTRAAPGTNCPVTGPVGAVAGGIGGNIVGGELRKQFVGSIYDHSHPTRGPANPYSNMSKTGTTQVGNQTALYQYRSECGGDRPGAHRPAFQWHGRPG